MQQFNVESLIISLVKNKKSSDPSISQNSFLVENYER